MFAIFLPLALAVIMFGLGLTLTVGDFARVLRYPRAAIIALLCQMVLLPLVCLGLLYLFRLEGVLAVGMMLLVASPGGPSANLFSHLAGGDVALNITLTAINSVLALFTLPFVVAFAYGQFLDDGASLGVQPAKFIQVFAIVLIPAAIGMWVHHRFTAWAERMRGTVKILSMVVLALVIIAAFAKQLQTVTDNVTGLVIVSLLLSTASFTIGYFVPRLFRVDTDQAIASAFEIGIHNGALAIAIAATVLHSDRMAVAPAVYSLLMNIPAIIAAFLLARHTRRLHKPEVSSAAALPRGA